MSVEPILLPSGISFEEGDAPNKATLVVEPCYHGYGTTLGNALRRVMLSSLPGAGITSIKLEGATHEFTTIPNVMEDVVEITLNLKQLRLKVHTDNPVRLTLNKTGEGPVTAGDFAPNADVEIANPDLVIATITDKSGTFAMEALVETGRGYVPIEEREKEESEVGLIKLDAMYSPVRNVSFRVEPVRIGEITNFDKLIMDIETDGTLTPQEAVEQSTQILLDYFNVLLPNEAEESTSDAPEVEEPTE